MTVAAIDPTARIAGAAEIGRDVSIGPYCVVGPDVSLGDGCRLVAHVHLTGHTSIGPRTVIHPFASSVRRRNRSNTAAGRRGS